MSLKTILTGLFVLGVFFSCTSKKDAESSAEDNLRNFYTYYITQLEKTFPNQTLDPDSMSKYCSAQLIKEWEEEIQFDKMLQAQDYDVEWVDRMKINAVPSEENVYRICFKAGATQGHCIRTKMIREGDLWKIDRVMPGE